MRVRAMRGGLSGGTVASVMNVVKEAAANSGAAQGDRQPVLDLSRRATHRRCASRTSSRPQYDAEFDAWIAPFVMSAVNTRVVQRSNALSKQAYGAEFRYDEAMLMGRGLKGRAAAAAMTRGLGGFMVAGALPPTRWALERFVLPAPGEGPSAEAQRNGLLRPALPRQDGGRPTLRVKVTGDRDPGYGSTAKMLGQAGAFLARDLADSGPKGGFWTPATVFGERLIERLVAARRDLRRLRVSGL